MAIRVAELEDIPRLLEIEEKSFTTDNISRRSFQYILTKANAVTLIDDDGYILALFRKGSKVARIYSVAVVNKRKGLGRELVYLIERIAWIRRCTEMKLEICVDNTPSRRFFESLGYEKLGEKAGFYEDGTTAWQYRKAI